MKTLKLTKTQLEILSDRLELDDCLSEVLSDYPEDDVCRAAEKLLEGKYHLALEDPLYADVLAEAVEGSTWYARRSADVHGIALANVERSCEALARKVGEFLGRDVDCPVW